MKPILSNLLYSNIRLDKILDNGSLRHWASKTRIHRSLLQENQDSKLYTPIDKKKKKLQICITHWRVSVESFIIYYCPCEYRFVLRTVNHLLSIIVHESFIIYYCPCEYRFVLRTVNHLLSIIVHVAVHSSIKKKNICKLK